ncbi:unnamed protein product (plasmid) [Mycetohabitans rhizoxinica HKI 454]|uniref:Uncharacterized protein n=1 Tax=Mycetohabitans rhizoxinica (strain DSM 19002 / CIP 109453 / HKI 454) TaxID=882378 RepID=E5AUT6_MYCRK|nr:unnamed protein product [Mycetohabitans rhizoxinica HKI 454]
MLDAQVFAQLLDIVQQLSDAVADVKHAFDTVCFLRPLAWVVHVVIRQGRQCIRKHDRLDEFCIWHCVTVAPHAKLFWHVTAMPRYRATSRTSHAMENVGAQETSDAAGHDDPCVRASMRGRGAGHHAARKRRLAHAHQRQRERAGAS